MPLSRLVLLACLLLGLAACGGAPLVRAGGEYSGVPDSVIGDRSFPFGTLSTDGVIRLERERGWP
jgi:hypothetical protein